VLSLTQSVTHSLAIPFTINLRKWPFKTCRWDGMKRLLFRDQETQVNLHVFSPARRMLITTGVDYSAGLINGKTVRKNTCFSDSS